MKVFLGGTTSGWKWRNKFQKMLECNYYNPITHGWSEKDSKKKSTKEKQQIMSCMVLQKELEEYIL